MFNETWEGVKAWFSHAESIFLARLEVFIGVIVGAVGAFDWSPLISMGMGTSFTKGQAMFLGGIMAVKGLAAEFLRRRNDPLLKLETVPETAEVVAAKQAVAKVAVKAEKAAEKAES